MRALIRLALPTSAMFFGIMAMGLVDMLFVGRLGAAALGGMGLGNSIFSWVMTVGIGLLFGLDFPIAHAVGAGDRPRAFRAFVQGMHLSALIAIPAAALVVLIALSLGQFGLNPEVIPFARSYMLVSTLGFFPIFLFNSAKAYLQAQNIAIPTFIVLVIANLLNFFMNAGFLEGRFGFPNLGYNGLAISTLIGRYIMAGMLMGYLFFRERGRGLPFNFSVDRGILREIVKLGVPASAQMLLEVGVFSLSTVLAARFVATDLAAHQIVLAVASALFMVPLGIGSAAASLVGQAVGACDYALARRTGYSALALGLGFALFSSVSVIVFSDQVLGIYTTNPAVIHAAKMILFIAALFQISDGAQVIASGALRGIGNTMFAAVANGIGHWLIGLPLGLILGFTFSMGITGIWIGLATGLTAVAVALVIFWVKHSATVGTKSADPLRV